MAYVAPTSGAVGPGGAKFGMGSGGPNRFNHTQLYGGLWSIGIDPNSPTLQQDVQRWYDSQPQAVKNEVQKGMGNQPGRGSINPLVYAVDWRQRDVARKIQKENGFFQSLPGKIVGIGATALGSVLGGPIGGAIAGGVTGGLSSGNVLGGLTGALGGYFGGGLLNKAGIPTNVLNLPGGGTISGAFSGLKALGSSAPLTNINNLMPAAYASRAAGTATGLAGNVGSFLSGGSGVANAATGGTSNMGWFTDILKSAAPDILSGAISGGISYLGNQSAINAQQKAAQQAQAAAQFRPYNVSGPTGSASFSGTTATGSLSPEMQRMLAQFEGIQGGALSDYNKFNTGNFSQNYYDTIKRYKQPYDQAQTEQLLERMYNMGNWESTTGARDVYSYQQAKRLEDDMLRIQAQQAGAQEQDRLFDRYFKASSAVEGLRRSPLELITMGGNLGGTAGSINASAAQYPWLAARNAADASAAFWSNIGTSAGNAASSILNAYNNTKNMNRPITYEPSPYFSGGNSTYLWS